MEMTTQEKRELALEKARATRKANKDAKEVNEGVGVQVNDSNVEEKQASQKSNKLKDLEAEELEKAKRARERYLADGFEGGFNKKLTVPNSVLNDKNYYYRWTNENKLADVERKGYIFHRDASITSDKEGVIARRTGTKLDGSPSYSYLMKQPIEYREGDLRIKNKVLDKVEDDLMRGKEARISSGDTSERTVREGNSIKHG